MSNAMEWPGDGVITPAWARLLAATLDANSRSGAPPKNLAKVFPKAVHEKLMKHVGALLQARRSDPCLLLVAHAHARIYQVAAQVGDVLPEQWKESIDFNFSPTS